MCIVLGYFYVHFPFYYIDSGRFNYPPSLTNTTTGNKANSQANSEHNKGEYKLWSDTNSFGKFLYLRPVQWEI